jgi:hypothetical protein
MGSMKAALIGFSDAISSYYAGGATMQGCLFRALRRPRRRRRTIDFATRDQCVKASRLHRNSRLQWT